MKYVMGLLDAHPRVPLRLDIVVQKLTTTPEDFTTVTARLSKQQRPTLAVTSSLNLQMASNVIQVEIHPAAKNVSSALPVHVLKLREAQAPAQSSQSAEME